MEFKDGITWAGSIYDKFEALCLEVEEVIYEDTVKYMENQVQKVGASVKKFYSEVMQDLIPPSCIDPVKVSAGDLPLNPYGHADTNKKPKLSILENRGALMKKETEVHNSDITSCKTSFNIHNAAKHQLHATPKVLVEYSNSSVCSKTNKRLGIHRRAIGIKRISQTNRPPKISGPVHQEKSSDRSSMAAPDLRSDFVGGSDDTNVTRPSEFSVECESVGAELENMFSSDALDEAFASGKKLSAESLGQEKDNSEGTSPTSDKILSAESVWRKKDISECTSYFQDLLTKPVDTLGTSMEGISSSQWSSSATSNAYDADYVDPNFVTCYEDKSMDDGSFSHIYSEDVSNDMCKVESAGGEFMVSYEENLGLELIDNEEVAESAKEFFKLVEESKLEDSCVFVEVDPTHHASQKRLKQKSYKKKLQEALSLKFRSMRKQNQRICQHKDIDGKNNPDVSTPDLATKSNNHLTSPACDPFGSDWELI